MLIGTNAQLRSSAVFNIFVERQQLALFVLKTSKKGAWIISIKNSDKYLRRWKCKYPSEYIKYVHHFITMYSIIVLFSKNFAL